MAKVGILDARLARLQEQVRKAKEMQSAIRRQRRAVQKEDEKRRIWIVGMCAMAGMRDARVREVVAAELAKDGVLRRRATPSCSPTCWPGRTCRPRPRTRRGAPWSWNRPPRRRRPPRPSRSRRWRPSSQGVAGGLALLPPAVAAKRARNCSSVSPGLQRFLSLSACRP